MDIDKQTIKAIISDYETNRKKMFIPSIITAVLIIVLALILIIFGDHSVKLYTIAPILGCVGGLILRLVFKSDSKYINDIKTVLEQ